MAGAHVFQAVQHMELDILGQLFICNFLKTRARFMRIVAQNNTSYRVDVTLITMVVSIYSELLESTARYSWLVRACVCQRCDLVSEVLHRETRGLSIFVVRHRSFAAQSFEVCLFLSSSLVLLCSANMSISSSFLVLRHSDK
jgi:hypothetical protein